MMWHDFHRGEGIRWNFRCGDRVDHNQADCPNCEHWTARESLDSRAHWKNIIRVGTDVTEDFVKATGRRVIIRAHENPEAAFKSTRKVPDPDDREDAGTAEKR